MFKRLRQLNISLAAKCQILFGAAVALIIAAALFVPWHRMEQLTEQINERAARVLCDDALADHMADPLASASTAHVARPLPKAAPPTTAPAASQPASIPPDTKAGSALAARGTREGSRAGPLAAAEAGRAASPPRLILAADAEHADLTAFERRAIKHFADHRDADYLARTSAPAEGSVPSYRYVRPIRADVGCLDCHTEHGVAAAPPATLATAPTTRGTKQPVSATVATSPTTRPVIAAVARPAAHNPVVAFVSVDMRSQVDTNQLLLNRIFLFTAGLLAGTLAIIVFYLITTRLILQPVRVLQETAEKVSEGDLNIRSHISTGDEFEQLSKTFNVMLTNLQAGEQQLRTINKSLDLKLGQLAESNVALYESNRLKSEFLANVSHELRTPLNSILGFAELLKDHLTSEPRAARYIQNILTSGHALLDLINDLLDLAKIEAGRMEVRSEPLSLNDVFEGLASIIKPLAEKQKVSIETNVARDVPILRMDGPKLQQVLYNLLSNAIKFSPADGAVDLRAELADEEYVRISVTDQGPGIEPGMQEVIFEKFRQIDGSVTRQHGGSGLGLSISKELVQLLGGTMGVISTPGHGSTFWIILPVKIDARQHDVRSGMVMS